MTDKPVSPYIAKHPIRELCPVCRERPAKQETEVCQTCEDDAQANVKGHCPHCGNPGVKPYEHSTIGPRWHCLHCGADWSETAEIIDLDASDIRAWGG